ncbi:hypothetical protein [Leucobacter sp. GX24907]
MSFSVTTAGVILPVLPEHVRSVDLCFGEDRIWSLDLSVESPGIRGRYRWPAPLVPYLRGHTEVVLRDSGDGREIARTTATFSDDDTVTRVVDGEGIPLAINKWGRLGKTLEAGNAGVQQRILDRTEELVDHLTGMGLRPFVVGGTLLGAVRSNSLLPHDDDADLAYLSEHTNPADVALEGFRVGHRLEALGYELVRHSATHMQLYFRGEHGQLDHYVDVFAAFFTEDGRINQPFHVRGEMREDQMLPFSTVTIEDRPFPAPADPGHWLVINYDENWRTPIPGYRLATPRATIRRFRNWFGSFHFTRDFWNERYAQDGVGSDSDVGPGAGAAGVGVADQPWRTGAAWILAQERTLTSPWLIDLGSGSGALSAELARDPKTGERRDRRVIAADYSVYAREAAERRAGGVDRGGSTARGGNIDRADGADRAGSTDQAGGADFALAHVNLLRTHSLGLPVSAGIDGPFDLVANHVIDHLGPQAIPNALRLIRMALRSGGSAVATLYGAPDLSADPGEPTSWGFAPDVLQARAAEFGMDVRLQKLRPASHERRRAPYGAVFTPSRGAFTDKESS